MVVKPAVTRVPIIVTATGVVGNGVYEVVSIHYVNTTAGVGQVTVTNNNINEGVVLGSDAVGGSDDWCPAQPAKFTKLQVNFNTGTGYVVIQVN